MPERHLSGRTKRGGEQEKNGGVRPKYAPQDRTTEAQRVRDTEPEALSERRESNGMRRRVPSSASPGLVRLPGCGVQGFRTRLFHLTETRTVRRLMLPVGPLLCVPCALGG